jgi:hypothetical protein
VSPSASNFSSLAFGARRLSGALPAPFGAHGRALLETAPASSVAYKNYSAAVPWTRLYGELSFAASGAASLAAAPVGIWAENPAFDKTACFAAPPAPLAPAPLAVAGATTVSTAALQGGFVPALANSLASPAAVEAAGYSAAAVGAVAQAFTLPAAAADSGALVYNASDPAGAAGGYASAAALAGVSILLSAAAIDGAAPPAPGARSPRLRVLLELYANALPAAPYAPSEPPLAAGANLADAYGSLTTTLSAAGVAARGGAGALVTPASGSTLL